MIGKGGYEGPPNRQGQDFMGNFYYHLFEVSMIQRSRLTKIEYKEKVKIEEEQAYYEL